MCVKIPKELKEKLLDESQYRGWCFSDFVR